MRYIKKLIITSLFFGVFSSLGADLSIDAQIQNIKNAPPARRVEMMNALKVQLSEMNSQDRSATISKMRLKMGKGNSHQSNHAPKKNYTMQKRHADSMNEMNKMHRMNQKHVGEEFIHDTVNQPRPPAGTEHPIEMDKWIRH